MTQGDISASNLVPALADHARLRGARASYSRHGGDPVAWRNATLPIARDLMLPPLEIVPFDPVVLAEEERSDHVIRLIRLTLSPGMTAPALFALPKGKGPFPAVLALHDHGSEFRIGKEKCLAPPGPVPEAAALWWNRFFGGAPMAADLLRRGYAVLSVDALGWGGRPGGGYEAQQALASNLMALGLSAAGVMVFEDLRAAEFLAGRPEVDPHRIAAVGFSMGAFRAWQAAALSPHIKAFVAACWMASLPRLMVEGNNQTRGQSAFWMTHPMLARELDLPDVASLAAPKPACFLMGKDDPLFPEAAVDAAFQTLTTVWAAHGAGEKLWLPRVAGGHHFDAARQKAAYDWLQSHI